LIGPRPSFMFHYCCLPTGAAEPDCWHGKWGRIVTRTATATATRALLNRRAARPVVKRRHCAATAPPLRRHCAATAPPLRRHCAATAPPLRRPAPQINSSTLTELHRTSSHRFYDAHCQGHLRSIYHICQFGMGRVSLYTVA
jgi:hypothetical protein